MDHFSIKDETRLRGAVGSLDEAKILINEVLEIGMCPRAVTLIKDAKVLAKSASIILSRMGTK